MWLLDLLMLSRDLEGSDQERAPMFRHTCETVQQQVGGTEWVAASMSGTTSLHFELQMYVPCVFQVARANRRQVSEMAEEQELRDMFERFGRVTRVFLAKDRETGMAKGFAFISFQERTDAAKACEKMDGYGFKHLILRVEFAKKAA